MGMTSKEAIAWLGNTVYDPKDGLKTTFSHELVKKCLDGLHLLEKQEQGLIQILPCKVGTPLYEINERSGIKCMSARPAVIGRCIQNNLIGKTVFFTHEGAEQALKECEKNEID